MSDFESNIRSVQRAVCSVDTGELGAWVRLVPEGIHIHVTDGIDRAVDHRIAWHELASWRAPQGGGIVQKLVKQLNAKPKGVFP